MRLARLPCTLLLLHRFGWLRGIAAVAHQCLLKIEMLMKKAMGSIRLPGYIWHFLTSDLIDYLASNENKIVISQAPDSF
jgi:hypothetical protein